MFILNWYIDDKYEQKNNKSGIAGAFFLLVLLVLINYEFINLAFAQESTRQAKRISTTNRTETSSDASGLASVDLAIDKFGNVFVADSGNHKIQKFDGSGKFLASWSY